MLWRDGRLALTGLAMTGLLAVALGAGWASAARVASERHDAEHAARSQWEGQGHKNPHAAGHYGAWVFQPLGPLAAFDPGATPWLGAALELKAHGRSLGGDAAARDATALSRFGGLSGAEVLFLLAPLLVIALGFGAWAGEREGGTLRQLASLGVRPRQLLAGKATGLLAALGLTTGPPLLVALAVAAALGADPDVLTGDDVTRLAGLAGFATAYLLGWVGVTLTISARARTTRGALVALMALWGITSLLVPRAGVALADHLAPPPTREALVAELRDALAPADREERVLEIVRRLEIEAGLVDAGLFVDEATVAGVELRAEAAFEARQIDAVFHAADERLLAHRRATRLAALASPYVAIRALSAALAGTDQAHHTHFATAGEAYRRELIGRLDSYFAEHGGDKGWDFRVGSEVWATMPAMRYQRPSAAWALAGEQLAAAIALTWMVLGAVGAVASAARVRVA